MPTELDRILMRLGEPNHGMINQLRMDYEFYEDDEWRRHMKAVTFGYLTCLSINGHINFREEKMLEEYVCGGQV